VATTPITFLPDVTVGNPFSLAVQFTDPNQNFQNVVVTANMGLSIPPFTNPVVQFVPVISFPIPGNYTTFTVLLTLLGSQTASIGPTSLVGDIVLSMSGYGPYSALSYGFNIISGVTLNSTYVGNLAIVTTATSTTLQPNTVTIIQGATGPITLTMPTLTGSGQVFVVKNQTVQTITVSGPLYTTASVASYNLLSTTATFVNDGTQSLGNGYINLTAGS